MNKELEKVAEHIKESMCVDGTVEFLTFRDIGKLVEDSNGTLVSLQGAVFECNDSERGQFFIGWYVPEELD